MADVDPITEEQWNCAYPCKFTTTDYTKREHNLNDQPYFCNIPRQSYLFLNADSVVDHFFENRSEVKDCTISFEAVAGEKRIPLPSFYSLGVLVDIVTAACGRLEWPLTISFKLTDHADNVAPYKIATIERDGFKQLRQQQKAICSAICGSASPMFTLAPDATNQLESAIRQNDIRAFYESRRLVMESKNGSAVRSNMPLDVCCFLIHKDGKHFVRLASPTQTPTFGAFLRETLECCALVDNVDINEVLDEKRFCKVLLSGVSPTLCTPIEFLMDHMCSPDFAVHLTVIQPQGAEGRGLLPARNFVIAPPRCE
jgi:hypothetical protein